eukprot:3449003-Pyramimonas_sp.AAC.1
MHPHPHAQSSQVEVCSEMSGRTMAMLLHMPNPAHWFTPLTSRRHLQAYEPTMRMMDDECSYKLIATVPGVAADGVTFSVTDEGLLKVDAKSKSDGRE